MTARIIAIVVPCFNEARRLDVEAFVRCARQQEPYSVAGLRFIFVDDGSRDGTNSVLQHLVARLDGTAEVLTLASNGGKAEAVRKGMLFALQQQPAFVGYWDADLATPLTEVRCLVGIMEERKDISFVLGARVQLMGRHIERRFLRHYLGRMFATGASIALRMPIYDTQCGAKLIRVGPDTSTLFTQPFRSRWAFDVELLARFIDSADDMTRQLYEHPLATWVDVGGSKLSAIDFFKAAKDLLALTITRRMQSK